MSTQGRDSVTRSRCLVLGWVALASLAGAAGCKKELKEFSPDGKFKVLMPGTPQEQTQFASGVVVKIWAVDQGSSAYMVSATDLPQVEMDVAQVLDGAVKGGAASGGVTVAGQSNITLGGSHPGREFHGAIPGKGAMRARVYLVDKRLYQLLALGNQAFVDSADVARFFDSFQLL